MFDDYPRNAGDPGIPNPCCGSFKTQMISARTAFRQWRFVRRFSTSGVQMESGAVYDSVQQYYGKVLGGSKVEFTSRECMRTFFYEGLLSGESMQFIRTK
eukprot:540132-Amorphochlora_amoeboformis.AAC.2